MNAQTTDLDTMTAAFDDSKELYFTFNEGNNELAILKVDASKAATLDTSELSYYGGKWQGPMGFAAVVAEIDEFLEGQVDEFYGDNEEADRDAADEKLHKHYIDALVAADVLDEFEPGTSIWELRGEDDDNSLGIFGDDVREMLGK